MSRDLGNVVVLLAASLSANTFVVAQGEPARLDRSSGAAFDKAITFAYYPGLKKLEVRVNDLAAEGLRGENSTSARIWRRGGDHPVAQQTFALTNQPTKAALAWSICRAWQTEPVNCG